MPEEPGAGLNQTEKQELVRLLRRLNEMGLTILIVEHDMSLVSQVASTATVLNFGKKIAEGSVQAGLDTVGRTAAMLAIARGLMSRPKVLLMDEPLLGLAPILVQEVFRVYKEINAAGTTILLVEQNATMALSVSHRGYVMETGQSSWPGTPRTCCRTRRCGTPTWAGTARGIEGHRPSARSGPADGLADHRSKYGLLPEMDSGKPITTSQSFR